MLPLVSVVLGAFNYFWVALTCVFLICVVLLICASCGCCLLVGRYNIVADFLVFVFVSFAGGLRFVVFAVGWLLCFGVWQFVLCFGVGFCWFVGFL